MRAGREKFHSDARAFLGSVPDIDDAAFLLFLGYGIAKHHVGAELDFLSDIQQPSMRIDHDGLAALPELAALNALAGCLHRDAREDARAAPLVDALIVCLCFRHIYSYRAWPGGESQ